MGCLQPAFKQAWGVSVRPLHEALFGNSRPAALTRLATVGLVLLIACANVANLLLARAAGRQGEIAVRVALGATRGGIVRQLLTESLLRAGLGGLAGVWFGLMALDPLVRFTGAGAVPGLSIGLNRPVLAFALATTGCTGLLFGLFPALAAARFDLQAHLKDAARQAGGGGRRRLQSGFIVAETALTVVLLVTAGLLLCSFIKALRADPGFIPENVLLFTLSQPGASAPTTAHRSRFSREVIRRLEQLPGVAAAGVISSTPMNRNAYYGDRVSREDRPDTRDDLTAGFDGVNGDVFRALGIPMLRGRAFTAADDAESAPRVVILDEGLARRLFPDEDALGQLIHFKHEAWQVVGVVGGIRRFQLDVDPGPQLYYPQIHFPWHTTYVVRTRVAPLTLADDIRRVVRELDPEIPVASLQTLEAAVAASLGPRQVVLTLLGVFGAGAGWRPGDGQMPDARRPARVLPVPAGGAGPLGA